MTAAFDATRGTDQRFNDALSGSDGTADPSVMMPVLDVYPDALSAPMPIDLVPIVLPRIALPTAAQGIPAAGSAAAARPGGSARPPAARQPAPRPRGAAPQTQWPSAPRAATAAARPAQARPAAPRPAQPSPAQPRSIAPSAPTRARPGAAPQPANQQQAPRTFNWQGMSVSGTDFAEMFRSNMPGRSAQVDRESFQATHPQSMGSSSPNAVAPAAPMASQYSGRGAARNTARDQAQERRRVTNTVRKKGSSAWAVIVFLVVIAFATGIGQRIIDLITELLNR